MVREIRKHAITWLLVIGVFWGALSCAKTKKPFWYKNDVLVDAARVDASYFPFFAEWLEKSGKNPVDYIVEKCQEHKLVIVGEQHYIKNYCELFKQAVPEVYRKAGIRVVALEVCNADDNEKIARLVNSDQYNRDLAYEIARSQNWGLWGYKEYWDILEEVWALNKSLPPGEEHMRVVGIDKEMDYQLDSLWRADKLKDPVFIEKAKNQPDIYKRDDWLVENIENEILNKGAKGIVLVGFNHSFTHYAQPKLNKEMKLEWEWPRMANLLYQKYRDKIFQIGLHGPQMSPAQIDKTYKGEQPVLSDLIERIMAADGNKALGFDVVDSPFANIRDSLSYYFHWQPKVRFADLSRGFIFLKPYKALSPCGWMDDFISEEMFGKSKAFYEFSYGRKFQNSREVNEFFQSGLKTL